MSPGQRWQDGACEVRKGQRWRDGASKVREGQDGIEGEPNTSGDDETPKRLPRAGQQEPQLAPLYSRMRVFDWRSQHHQSFYPTTASIESVGNHHGEPPWPASNSEVSGKNGDANKHFAMEAFSGDFGSPVAEHMSSSDNRRDNLGMDEAKLYRKLEDDRNMSLMQQGLSREKVVLRILHMVRVREFTDYDPKQKICLPYRYQQFNIAFFDLDKDEGRSCERRTLLLESYLSIVELAYIPVIFALEASIGVNVFLDGKFYFMGKIAAWTTETKESKFILYDSEVDGTETKLGNGGAVSLTRHVVAVPHKEFLFIDVSVYDGNRESICHKCARSNSFEEYCCKVGPYELKLEITWKQVRKRYRELCKYISGTKVLWE
ncbi:hypothetical protein PR202_ga24259 [Eleusine coracana subsp. coracana]|uniref:DUF6598 domain-containing protein n=1 Tax=Eleusine coracana subsp. coracana TaxID=191504 RepID=A0AAV5D7X0_ELECO|nr:hypothetical protein PR202_ga24259 [Eleusine coracana subsp. coracana]